MHPNTLVNLPQCWHNDLSDIGGQKGNVLLFNKSFFVFKYPLIFGERGNK